MKYSLERLARIFGNEVLVKALANRLGIRPDSGGFYSEADYQRMRSANGTVTAESAPMTWVSLDRAGRELGMERGKVYSLAERGELTGDLFRRGQWKESMILQSSIPAYVARMRQEIAQEPAEVVKGSRGARVPVVSSEPIVLPPAPLLQMEEASRPFWSRRRASSAEQKGFQEVIRG